MSETHSNRLPINAWPKPALEAMMTTEKYLSTSSLEQSLLELVRLHVSQINGCAFCIDMHVKELKAASETDQRMFGLSAWRETPYYSEKERAALNWAEAVTRLGPLGVEDAAWHWVEAQFTHQEIADLTVTILQINSWNRWAVATRPRPGDYVVGQYNG